MFAGIFTLNTPSIKKEETKKDYLFETTFQLPIYYLENKHKLSTELIKDLELNNTQNNSDTVKSDGIYKILFDIKTGEVFKNEMVKKWCEYYTTNTEYINDTIKIIKSPLLTDNDKGGISDESILTIWNDLKNDEYFLEK